MFKEVEPGQIDVTPRSALPRSEADEADLRLPAPHEPGKETEGIGGLEGQTAALAVHPKESPLDKLNPQIREYLLQKFNEAQLSLLLQKTPRREVRTRLLNPNRPEGPANPRLKYVEHAYVTETLNYLFGFCWDLEVLAQERIDNEAVVKARLSIRLPDSSLVVKDGFGGAFFQPNNPNASWADTYKAAESDALKAAAARLGIGLDLYRHEEQLQEGSVLGEQGKAAPPEKKDWSWFWGKVKEKGLSREEVHARLGVSSVKDWVAGGKTLDEALRVLGEK